MSGAGLVLVLLAGLVLAGVLLLGSLGQVQVAMPQRVQVEWEAPRLPGPHEPVRPREDGHYTANGRLQQAEQARAIISDPGSQCDFYQCDGSGSVMRTCTVVDAAGRIVYAMQWMYFEGGAWCEGSAWVQDNPGKAERYLRNQGCID
jgi:hypothetical protein